MPSDVTYTGGPLTDEEIEILAHDLRAIEQEDVLRTFESVEDAVRSCCLVSDYLKVIRFHGQPISVFGVVRDPVAGYGSPWMLTTDLLSFAHPVRIVREGRKMMEEIVQLFPVMHNIVPVEDVEAQSMLSSLGFEILENREKAGNGHDYLPFWYGRAA